MKRCIRQRQADSFVPHSRVVDHGVCDRRGKGAVYGDEFTLLLRRVRPDSAGETRSAARTDEEMHDARIPEDRQSVECGCGFEAERRVRVREDGSVNARQIAIPRRERPPLGSGRVHTGENADEMTGVRRAGGVA